RRRPDAQLRSVHGPGRDGHRHPRRLLQPRGHRRGPSPHHLVHRSAVPRLHPLPDRRHRRNPPLALGPARGGKRTGGRLPLRIFGHEIRHVLRGRIPRGDLDLLPDHGAVPRRLARPRLARPDLVPDQDDGLHLLLHPPARRPPPSALRSADGLGLEADAPAVVGQPPGHRRHRPGGAVMFSNLRTLWEVFLHAFRPRVTVQYPEQKAYLSARYRGRIILARDPDGGERCVACYLCAVACPVDCIALQAAEDSTGRRYPEFFRINFSRCIYCGYCEEACPTYAIQLTPDVEMSEYQRQNMVYEKEDLLISGPGKYPGYNFWRVSGVQIGGKAKGEGERESPPVDLHSLLP